MTTAYPEALRRLVDQGLVEFFPPADSRAQVVHDAMRYAVFGGGKRFRPVLALLAAQALGRAPADVLPSACAIEFVHTYSLIHDDLPALDNDDLRRGQPTCHVKFGEDIAILAGDALLAEAFGLVAGRQAGQTEQVVAVVAELARAAGVGGMVGGQAADILATGRRVDRSELEYIHERKTGRLIGAAARTGAILAGAEPPVLGAVTEYAGYLGLAFQVIDDILDVVGVPEVLGKNIGGDAAHDKSTFPAVLGVEQSREEARRYAALAKESLAGIPIEAEGLVRLADFVTERDS